MIEMNEKLLNRVEWLSWDLFNDLLKVSTPITMSLVIKHFMAGYETADMIQEARIVLVQSVNTYDDTRGTLFVKFYYMKLLQHFTMLVRGGNADKRKVNINMGSLDELKEEVGDYIQGTSSVLTQPENVIIAKEAYEGYIDLLSKFERQVYLLFIDGKTVEQISKILGSTETQVSNAWYRCTIKFKIMIQ